MALFVTIVSNVQSVRVIQLISWLTLAVSSDFLGI